MNITKIIIFLWFLTKEIICLPGDYKNITAKVFVRNETVPYVFHEVLDKYFDYGFEFKKNDKNISKMLKEDKICQFIFIVDFNTIPINDENYQSTFIFWNTKYNNVTIRDNKNILYLEDQNINNDNTFEKIIKNSLIFSNVNERCTIDFEFSLNYLYRKKIALKTGYIIFIFLITLLPIIFVIFKQ
ncbi:Hypothetical protein SRAE_2000271450 [Strongyloides ratti]|uniref:Uncharacterized protein n=1 Tax=Strongyloides ratti TaxID=34506 RepID=A0A090LKG9_STRRB|nr:Hypothetical protein SRAE_2000271450 [Strongyloides ratti]CEF68055.1 Hypothetical protein SRAE_2000271450 [Strongyloides ratti]